MCGYRILTPEESEAYRREKDAEMDRSRRDTGVIGKREHNGTVLNIIGPRHRPNGGPVKREKRMVEQRFSRAVEHLRHVYPMTSFEILLEDIGAWTRQWEDEERCYTCDGTGTIQKDNPHHFHYWARRQGDKCARCSGQGRVLYAREERVSMPKDVARGPLLYKDSDDVMHLVTKKGKERSTRCRVFKGIDVRFLSGYGRASCMMCLAWMP